MEKYKAVIYSAFVTYPLLVNIPVWYILPLYTSSTFVFATMSFIST